MTPPSEKTLQARAAAARTRADELEAARIAANIAARQAAAEAAALDRAVEAQAYADHVAEFGEPTRARVNIEASTHAELQAALGSGAMTEQLA